MVARHVRRRLPAAARAVPDAAERASAADLQATCRSWLVIWSPWRRTFTGFACFTAGQVIIDEADKDAFLEQVKQVELANSVGRVA